MEQPAGVLGKSGSASQMAKTAMFSSFFLLQSSYLPPEVISSSGCFDHIVFGIQQGYPNLVKDSLWILRSHIKGYVATVFPQL